MYLEIQSGQPLTSLNMIENNYSIPKPATTEFVKIIRKPLSASMNVFGNNQSVYEDIIKYTPKTTEEVIKTEYIPGKVVYSQPHYEEINYITPYIETEQHVTREQK